MSENKADGEMVERFDKGLHAQGTCPACGVFGGWSFHWRRAEMVSRDVLVPGHVVTWCPCGYQTGEYRPASRQADSA